MCEHKKECECVTLNCESELGTKQWVILLVGFGLIMYFLGDPNNRRGFG